LACSAGFLGAMSAVLGKIAGSVSSDKIMPRAAMYTIMLICNVGDVFKLLCCNLRRSSTYDLCPTPIALLNIDC
jgi:hypothetical protein